MGPSIRMGLGYTYLPPSFIVPPRRYVVFTTYVPAMATVMTNDGSSQTRHDPETARLARLAALEGRTGAGGEGGGGGEAAAPLLAASDHDVLTLQVKQGSSLVGCCRKRLLLAVVSAIAVCRTYARTRACTRKENLLVCPGSFLTSYVLCLGTPTSTINLGFRVL